MNEKIISIIEELDVPVQFRHYTGKSDTYITFFTFLEKGELFGDDEEMENGIYIQLNIFSKEDYTDLVEKIKIKMKDNNFIKRYEADAPYEVDTKYYHKVLRYLYIE